MRLIAILPLILLAACQPKVIRVPVSSPCIKAEDVPQEVPPAGKLPEDARRAADLLGSIVSELRRTDKELRALIRPCTR